jgi:hypothetical protein
MNVLTRRPWWKNHKLGVSGSINFYWRSKPDVNYNLFSSYAIEPRMYNRLEGGDEISSKDNLFRNLWFLCNVLLADAATVHASFRHRASHLLFETKRIEFRRGPPKFCQVVHGCRAEKACSSTHPSTDESTESTLISRCGPTKDRLRTYYERTSSRT